MAEQEIDLTTGRESSAFNQAIIYLRTGMMLIFLAAEHQSKRELKLWFDVLRALNDIFKIKFSKDEIEKINKLDKEISDIFISNPSIDSGDFSQVIINGRTVLRLHSPEQREVLYRKISEYSYLIKKAADQHSMLLPSNSDPRFAVLNR